MHISCDPYYKISGNCIHFGMIIIVLYAIIQQKCFMVVSNDNVRFVQYGMSPVLWASWCGHLDALKMLVSAGATTMCTNKVS